MARLFHTAVLLALVLGACTSTPSGGVSVEAPWTRSANYTSCTQWLNEMTPGQRTAMVAPMLPAMRQTVDTAADDGAALVPAFVDAVSTACRSSDIGDPGAYVVTAAAALAFVTDDRFRP